MTPDPIPEAVDAGTHTVTVHLTDGASIPDFWTGDDASDSYATAEELPADAVLVSTDRNHVVPWRMVARLERFDVRVEALRQAIRQGQMDAAALADAAAAEREAALLAQADALNAHPAVNAVNAVNARIAARLAASDSVLGMPHPRQDGESR